jgi:DNA-binding MarR family transcriptional regulator
VAVSVPTSESTCRVGATGPAPDLLDVFRALVAAKVALCAGVDERLRSEHGLSLAAYDALVVLSETGGGSGEADLAAALALRGTDAAALLEELIRSGLVTRRREEDPAKSVVVLTLRGYALRRRAAATYEQVLRDLLGSTLSGGDITMLADVLVTLRDGFACLEATYC